MHEFSKDVCNRLYNFIIQGKMIRGGLVALGNFIYTKQSNEMVIRAAAAMEETIARCGEVLVSHRVKLRQDDEDELADAPRLREH